MPLCSIRRSRWFTWDLSKAVQHIESALATYRTIRDRMAETEALGILAKLQSEAGQAGGAEATYRKTIEALDTMYSKAGTLHLDRQRAQQPVYANAAAFFASHGEIVVGLHTLRRSSSRSTPPSEIAGSSDQGGARPPGVRGRGHSSSARNSSRKFRCGLPQRLFCHSANNSHLGAAVRRVTLRLQQAGFFNGCGDVLPPVTRTRQPRKKEKRIGFQKGPRN